MRRYRLIAATAGILTALLLQATLVAPLSGRYPISLPAVLVVAVALADGPAVGLSFGFAAGLVADLGSNHPAGILALCWLGCGLAGGVFAQRRGVRRDAAVAGGLAGGAGVAATVLLTAVHDGATLADVVRYALPAALGDVALALAVVPLVRALLRTHTLRAPHPVTRELAVSARHG